ncbi:MAG: hypothetical protein D6785_12820 [Planctomycetota bacterium]|nr:MAG: hypothetical protein D6785_12820 [Planctomycetota bacterium]
MSKENLEKNENAKKQEKKKPPKRKTLTGKLARFLFFLLLIISLAGVGHFYITEKRLPRTITDGKVIVKNLSTFFLFSTNLVKEKWKSLGLDKKTKKILDGFERLLAKKKTGASQKSSSSKEPTNKIKSANIQPDPAKRHILKGKDHFIAGKEYLHRFRSSRNAQDLNNAKKELQQSRIELEKASQLTHDKEMKELIQGQLSEVGKLLSDCSKLGSM